MKASGWSNSTPNNLTGSGYGIRVTYQDRDRYFQKEWDSVEVALNSGKIVELSLPETFWTTCPELKNVFIGRWMLEMGVAPWAKSKPPKFDLEPVEDRRFKLTLS